MIVVKVDKLTFVKLAEEKFAPSILLAPDRAALVNVAPEKLAFVKVAPDSLAPVKFALDRLKPLKFKLVTVALEKLAPTRFAFCAVSWACVTILFAKFAAAKIILPVI